MNFDDLRLLLARWPADAIEIPDRGDVLLTRIVRGIRAPNRTSADLLPLLRQSMRREAARIGRVVPLRLPVAEGWPARPDYPEYGFRIVQDDGNQVVVEARPWCPNWLTDGRCEDPFDDAFAEVPSRRSFACPIDPIIAEATGFAAYNSPGQRAAVHAVLMSASRSTLVVTLPTGSGKSLVAQAPALLAGEGACTVVVVPTVSLALDQQRQFRVLWRRRHPSAAVASFAWHSGTPEADKERIKNALRSGRQPILFTSPESVVGGLRFALHEAAARGYVKYLVVDEAHLVAQWGDSFRPEFQSLAAFRQALLEAAPRDGFKTILMTATLTADALATVETLFNHERTAELIASVYVRTEPRYFFAKAEDANDQETKVLTLLRHAPRPLILYVTEVKKAKRWKALLQSHGWGRVGLFHGQTPQAERQRLIDEWAADELDIMVATSAFGVGIDKRDVRCIVHACVPESLDRYYQEVGRGGRDGRACVAACVWTEADLDVARGIAAPALITAELGLPRWEAMLQRRTAVAGMPSTVRIDLATVPRRLHQETEYNRAWNLRTLMLLARARVIRLATEPPSSFVERTDASAELSEEQIRKLFDSVIVEILEPRHLDPEFWATHVEGCRVETLTSAGIGLKRMERVLAGQTDIGEELKALYTLREPGRSVQVSAACSGCPKCRVDGEAVQRLTGRPQVVAMEAPPEQELWRTLFPGFRDSPFIIVFDPSSPPDEATLDRLAMRLRDCGMREVHVRTSDFPAIRSWQVLRDTSAGRFVALTDFDAREDELSPVPRLTVFMKEDREAFKRLEAEGRPFEWILLPDTAVEPCRPDRKLADIRNSERISSILETFAACPF